MKSSNDGESFIYRMVDYWWGSLLVGTFMLWMAYQMYIDFTELEKPPPPVAESGGIRIDKPEIKIKVNTFFSVCYEWFGKWPVVTVAGGAGAYLVAAGIRQFFKGRGGESGPTIESSE